MKNKLNILTRSFLRISVIPVIVFYCSAWIVLNYTEPGYTNGGCLNYPEAATEELIASFNLALIYLCFTPVVFFNLVPIFSNNKLLRTSILFLPILPATKGIMMSLFPFMEFGGRVYLYTLITSLLTIFILLWNVKLVSKELN